MGEKEPRKLRLGSAEPGAETERLAPASNGPIITRRCIDCPRAASSLRRVCRLHVGEADRPGLGKKIEGKGLYAHSPPRARGVVKAACSKHMQSICHGFFQTFSCPYIPTSSLHVSEGTGSSRVLVWRKEDWERST